MEPTNVANEHPAPDTPGEPVTIASEHPAPNSPAQLVNAGDTSGTEHSEQPAVVPTNCVR